jgi:hypothetical protein
MARKTTDPHSSFLGGGPKFNRAGDNVPLPGEKLADVKAPLPFGGPRIWAGVAVVLALIVLLYVVYGNPLSEQRKSHGGGISSRAPDFNPDKPNQ